MAFLKLEHSTDFHFFHTMRSSIMLIICTDHSHCTLISSKWALSQWPHSGSCYLGSVVIQISIISVLVFALSLWRHRARLIWLLYFCETVQTCRVNRVIQSVSPLGGEGGRGGWNQPCSVFDEGSLPLKVVLTKCTLLNPLKKKRILMPQP